MSRNRSVKTIGLLSGFATFFSFGFALPASAGSYFQIVEYNGGEYCVTSGTGTYFFAGANVDGANSNPVIPNTNGRAGYSDNGQHLNNAVASVNNNGVEIGAANNRNFWDFAGLGKSPWKFNEYATGSGNNFAKSLSQQVPLLKFATGIGGSNRLRGFVGGEFQDYTNNTSVRAYSVQNSAYVTDIDQCVDDEGAVDIGLMINEVGDDGLAAGLMAKLSGASANERRERLGEVISSILLPRNVIAAGGLATQAFSNDLADTVLERLPTRYLKKVDDLPNDAGVVQDEASPSAEPVRGLWMKNGELDDQQASAFLDQSVSRSVDQNSVDLQLSDGSYVDNADPRSVLLSGGTRAWFRGFAGSMSPFRTGGLEKNGIYYPDVYNDFYSTHGGAVIGIATPISNQVQLGIFGHYGSISLNQFAGEFTGRGSWNPSGWGGGVSASYVDPGFYVQGLFGVTSFSGKNQRQVLLAGLIDETYTATKNTTSYVGAVRVGTPLIWGDVIVEPQLTAIWNANNDAEYSETGRYDAFALKVHEYSDYFLRTALGSKFAMPITFENGNLLTPSLRVAWLADWDTGNGDVSYSRAFADNGITAKIPSNQEMENGILLETGVDYSIFSSASSSWMLYGRGGAKIWFNKTPDWRVSGGITFRF